MEDPDLALRFAVAMGLGVLLGLERERSKGEEGGAGVRTFGLIALAGALSSHLVQVTGQSWIALATFAGIALLIVTMYVVTSRNGDTGITTEVSALMAFLLGLLCVQGSLQVAAWVAVAMALLLALRDLLRRRADVEHEVAGIDADHVVAADVVAEAEFVADAFEHA